MAGARIADSTGEAVKIGDTQRGLDTDAGRAALGAGAAVVVETRRLILHAPSEPAGLVRATIAVVGAAVRAGAGLADAGPQALVVVDADVGFPTEAEVAEHTRWAVTDDVAGIPLEPAAPIRAAAPADAAVSVGRAGVLTALEVAVAVGETVVVDSAEERLGALSKEAGLAAGAVIVALTALGDGRAPAIDAGLADRALHIRVTASIPTLTGEADPPGQAVGVDPTQLAFADTVDAALAEIAVGAEHAGVDNAGAGRAVLARRAVQRAEAHLLDDDLADALLAGLPDVAVGVSGAGRHPALAVLAGEALAAVAVEAARGLAADAGLTDPVGDAVVVGHAEGSLDAASARANLGPDAVGLGDAHRRRITPSGLADLVGPAGRVVPTRVRAGVDNANPLAQAVLIAAAGEALDAGQRDRIAQHRALAVIVDLTPLTRHAEAGNTLFPGAVIRDEAGVHTEARIAEPLAQAVFARPADGRLIALAIATAELRALAVVVGQTGGHDDWQLTVADVADLPGPAALVGGAGPPADPAVADAALVTVRIGLTGAALHTASLRADPRAFAVQLRLAAWTNGHGADLILADLTGRALDILLAAPVSGIGHAGTLIADLTIGAGVRRAGLHAGALAAEAFTRAVEIGAAELRLGAAPAGGVADLGPLAVGIGVAGARLKGNADHGLAGPAFAAVGAHHACALGASQVGGAPQVSRATRLLLGIAAVGAATLLADAVQVGVTGVVAPAGRDLLADARVADERARADVGVITGRAVHAGGVRAKLTRRALLVPDAALDDRARAATRLADAARAVAARRAGVHALEGGAITLAQAVVVGGAPADLDAQGGRLVAELGAFAVVSRTAVLSHPLLADRGGADLIRRALRARRAQLAGPQVGLIGRRRTAVTSGDRCKENERTEHPSVSPHPPLHFNSQTMAPLFARTIHSVPRITQARRLRPLSSRDTWSIHTG